ncbi:IQ and AAA domain-containing protein 1-like [Galleria mellonella]|uniref:IQ and AAA domain-containing protein 1-like n=1 Tax=Galleria mellonella TaxID=7137 RepID=A0A6J1WZJ8_GALME|nr:IQ and AAA domain-containing protein 1-like [Galleria mellonella]
MANKEYYERWLKIKEQMKTTLSEDERLNELATLFVGIKPQATAVEIVARVYSKYCELYNKLCDCYDQMEQVQRRQYIKKIIDAVTCRLLELKRTLEEVEVFEFTYPDNALQQLLMVPQDIKILCPFFYPFEIRQQEMQYIIDQIFAGNRIGDPTPTPSEIKCKEEERLEEERRKQEEKDAEIKRMIAMGEDISLSDTSVVLSPQELEEIRLREEYEKHINNIQRMERSRLVTRNNVHKRNKDINLYLELAGIKAPQVREELRIRAAMFIQKAYRRFMEIKREKNKDIQLRQKLGMIMPSWSPPSAYIQLEKVKEQRRNYRRKYYEKWMEENIKENARVLRLREGDIMEDISSEIRQWFQEWYHEVRLFDEFPWPEEGGSILVVKGETFTIEEYIDWRTAEEKRLKAEAEAPKTKEQIKAEKVAAREEKKRLAFEEKEREKKRLLDYKKTRLNPDNDPGIYISIGKTLEHLQSAWLDYQNQWQSIDNADPSKDAVKGYIMQLVTENAYKDVQLQLRPIVDEMMKLELNLLRNSLKADYLAAGIAKPPQSKKRKKPKKVKPPRPDKISPASMFQQLVDEGIVKKYPRTTLDDYWGDRNYAAADMRAVLWTPSFPLPCIGDVREQVRNRCLLTLGSSCPNAIRTQLLVGPQAAGKRTLIHAIATETNSILIDLSPMNVYNKFPGPKNLKTMFTFVNRISKLMQPTVIMVDNADKLFYKKVPKEEKIFDPTRLQKDFYKEVIKPIQSNDKILVLGTATEPWFAKNPLMYKSFPSLILIPRTDYGSLSLVLTKILMKYHGVDRDFNVHSVAQALRGYDINTIRKAIDNLMDGNRVAQLYNKPLDPMEVVNAVLDFKGAKFTDAEDFEMFQQWYNGYSPWGQKYMDYLLMLESQYLYKLKNDKKKK